MLSGGSGPENFFLRRALPIGRAKQAHTPPAVIPKFRYLARALLL